MSQSIEMCGGLCQESHCYQSSQWSNIICLVLSVTQSKNIPTHSDTTMVDIIVTNRIEVEVHIMSDLFEFILITVIITIIVRSAVCRW